MSDHAVVIASVNIKVKINKHLLVKFIFSVMMDEEHLKEMHRVLKKSSLNLMLKVKIQPNKIVPY